MNIITLYYLDFNVDPVPCTKPIDRFNNLKLNLIMSGNAIIDL